MNFRCFSLFAGSLALVALLGACPRVNPDKPSPSDTQPIAVTTGNDAGSDGLIPIDNSDTGPDEVPDGQISDMPSSCETAADCPAGGACDISIGACVECTEDLDCTADSECSSSTCEAGLCQQRALESGAECAAGFCNGAGDCLACSRPCASPLNACEVATCDADVCGSAPSPAGSPCPTGVCNGEGLCVECAGDSDCTTMSGECVQGQCNANRCEYLNLALGSACTNGTCDGSGRCRECSNDSECPGDLECDNEQCVCPTGSSGGGFFGGGGNLNQTSPTRCGDSCVDLNEDNLNCGSCGRSCTGDTRCDDGGCRCPDGRNDPPDVCGDLCVDLEDDRNNCGACGTVCATHLQCNDRVCGCGGGQSDCGDYCADLENDIGNCGGCGTVCSAHLGCNGGDCSCGGGQSDCGDYCADLENDIGNCGSCGKVCAEGQSCSSGGCRCDDGLVACGDTCVAQDNDNCGDCGHVCPGDLQCEGSGVCDAPAVDNVEDDDCEAVRRGGHDYLVCNGQSDGSGGLIGGGFGSSDGGNRGYAAARDFCKARGLDLAILDNEDENNWVQQYLDGGGNTGSFGGSSNTSRSYWIGASRVESEWRWLEPGGGDSAGLLSEGFTAWDSGQPQDNAEDCAVFLVERSFNNTSRSWHDVTCGNTAGWICESY